MEPLSEKTWIIVQELFPAYQQEEVRRLLETECGSKLPLFQNSPDQFERIRFAVLRLSRGHLDELYLQVIGAQTDWRNILMAAGFGESVHQHLRWADEFLAGERDPGMAPSFNVPMEAVFFEENWVKCPRCGWKFSTGSSGYSWTGERHRRCGQRLILKAG